MTPTAEHQQRAFDLLRRADWPATLADLLTAARQASLVHGLAQRLANGQGMTLPDDRAALADAAPPPVPLRAWDFPPRAGGVRAAGQTERRHRDSRPLFVDQKRLAAGDRD